MSDKGDKFCPLCTEEMDLTDQHLKPCKCGYQICVWCWNHIMEMAEKDNSDGRCPACRTAYDKEKITEMAANCERLVAEINSERKLKSQKLKPKTTEGRMHLSNVRVIQRNLVYVIGLPLSLADEALLQRREYFGQYGKVLKVSISRTATGVIQHSANNSFCVYITYSKEEEAVCCIQSVHSFVLEGRSLRACFGTTKYCHAWLKNTPCSVPDCLYLHDFGPQEDSFAKDDLVLAFTRSRVQQIIGATNNLHQHSENILPPPADEYSNRNMSSTAKLNSKCSSNQNIGNWDGVSCADSIPGISSVLDGAASWVTCVSANSPPATSLSGSVGTPKHEPETSNRLQLLTSEVVNAKRSGDVKGIVSSEGKSDVNPAFSTSSNHLGSPESPDINADITGSPASTSALKLGKLSFVPGLHGNANILVDRDVRGVCSMFSSMSIANIHKDECSGIPESSKSSYKLPGNQVSKQAGIDLFVGPSESLRESILFEDLLGHDDQQLEDGAIPHQSSMSYFPSSKQNLKQPNQQAKIDHQGTIDTHPSIVPTKFDEVAFPLTSGSIEQLNGFCNNETAGVAELDRKLNYAGVMAEMGLECLEKYDNSTAIMDEKGYSDAGESSIISSILSLDLDAWEDTLSSPDCLFKFLTETDKQHGPLKVPRLRKVQNISRSRFSFARQDEIFDQFHDIGHSPQNTISKSSIFKCSTQQKDLCTDINHEISLKTNTMESNGFLSSNFFEPAEFSVSKTPTSHPPGFSVQNRAVSPGYYTQANHFLQNSTPPNVGSSLAVEFTGPAIKEVGNSILDSRLNNLAFGSRPALSPRQSSYDHDSELQVLMRQTISMHENPRFADHVKIGFCPPSDSYGVLPMHLSQSPPNSVSAFAHVRPQQLGNLHMPQLGNFGRDGTRSINDLSMSELRTHRGMGFEKLIPSYEDLKCQMSGSSNLYHRGFAM